MSTPQGCTDDQDVVVRFKEALKHRVGQERFQIWFSGIRFICRTVNGDVAPTIVAIAHGQFAADRLSKNYLQAMRGAASSVCGRTTDVMVEVQIQPAHAVELPFEAAPDQLPAAAAAEATTEENRGAAATPDKASSATRRKSATAASSKPRSRRRTQSLSEILKDGTDSRKPARRPSQHPPQTSIAQIELPLDATAGDVPGKQGGDQDPGCAPATGGKLPTSASTRSETTWENFVAGNSSQLARTACKMVIENPALASPLVLWGPAGSGKTHLLRAVAGKLRSLHRMRRVVYLSAEEFTNDFIKALNANSLPAFRSRFRDADALLLDDIQFFVDKKATIRELHHTIEMLAEFGKPLLFAGTKAPNEIKGLGNELSGRLASGLVCQVQSMDVQTRSELLARYAEQRCTIAWPAETLGEIAELVDGDGRVISGIVNLVALLQRMYRQMPTMEQIRQHGGHLLRSAGVPITLNAIERAVERVFQLDSKSLQSGSQTKSITEPRMLAMYLSREMTSSAFSEIGGHYGGRSHSTAILASQRVRQWLDAGRSIGRGRAAVSTDEAIRRIESLLKTG
ncbi:DnaA/Hda family protein [Stieleria sp. TO1_6]|nr:DnaA/Hda family protein [Stieleria tagensis]